MKRKRTFLPNKITFALSLATALPGLSAEAMETRTINNPQGAPVFQVRYFDVGDGPFMQDDPVPMSSTWNLNSLQKDKIASAINYWATVITPAAGQPLAIVNVGTSDTKNNASGTSDMVSGETEPSLTQAQAVLTGQPVGELTFGSHAQFELGRMDFDTLPFVPSQLPRTDKTDVTAIALHELAHGLGIINSTEQSREDKTKPAFGDRLDSWAQHLRDDNGNPAQAKKEILCSLCTNEYDPTSFDVRKDQGYFTGENVNEVLAGAMPGVPVRMLGVLTDGTSVLDPDYMSHIELKNSLMSHQSYRNYMTFMEAELAVLQDLGYQIDRRNMFGYSVYGDGQTLYNQHGYYQRNAEGTDYLVGAYSTTTLGLGLHVYGSHNRIFQQADLLTRGDGAAGVRIDGEGNTLIVEPGTRIHADGLNGRGLLFAYGKDHNLIQRGDVEALGELGVAAEFNFGNNLLRNSKEYRGSFIRTTDDEPADPLPELQGALVNTVDISGRLAGSAAAISISDNALVKQINVLSGAQIEGNILSAYNQKDEAGQQRLTQLSFGRLNDGQGVALDQTDPNFRMRYDGNIQGINNLALNLRGGETSLGGQHQLYSVDVSEGATLAGTGTYQINGNGAFINRGTVAPGNSFGTLTVDGNYQQTDSGQLLAEVNDKGQHDTLKVNGNAALGGRLTVAPLRGWYSPQWTINSNQLLSATSTTGAFTEMNAAPISPTLSLLATPQGDGNQLLSFARTTDAYSQYATSQNGRSVGEGLSQSATANANASASADRQQLYTTLDFSAADGSTIAKALDQLSPSAYSAMMASSLQREQQVADAISAREPGKLRDDEWQAFIQPFGGNTRQNSDNHTVGYTTNSYGVIFGAEKAASSDGNLVIGLHGAASKQNLSLKDPQNGDGDTSALELGVHARYAQDPMAGSYMLGSARVGYESGELKRKLSFDDYSAQNKADWTGKSASVVGGGGYRFKLNENVSMGPLATLTYTSLWRDGTHEKGADGSALKLKSQQFDSLRSSVGLNSAMKFPLAGGRAIKAEGQITWDHELLNTDLIQDATFANYQGNSFRSKNTVMDRDSMGLRGNVRYSLSENVDIGAGVSSNLFRTGYNSVAGNLSLDWRF
ncbi:MAG: autotransporter domain-containing protein [Pseudomonas sp.]|uniref:autotransporter outer membrane beta-barrel domain-containing protein n=1 Tax=Pseudomonas sp. TaxID=306 RepID=UPI000CBD2D47|nr:autotransporter domain-containing protein [Pseudomonas sp.]PJI50061.1 MAG: autotransporter domain-containing protein [Pseudomonas sp.]